MATEGQKKAIRTMMGEMLKGKDADFSSCCEADCTFVVPGGPPLPIPVLAEMCGGMLQAFPWTNDVKFPEQEPNATTIKAQTKQIVGVMKGDIPATGPFPEVKKADVDPAKAAKAIILPWEMGTYTFVGDKVKSGTYAVDAPVEDDGDATTMDLPVKVGFPAIFMFLGIELPPPPMDILMMADLEDFDAWYVAFQQHKESKTFAYKGKEMTASMSRAEVMDASTEEIFYDIKDKNKIVGPLRGVNMPKMGALMSEPAFKEGLKDALKKQEMFTATPLPPPGGAPPPAGTKTPMMFFSYTVGDADKWIEGFLAHGTSKTGSWGEEAKYTRGEMCDESRTRIFRSAKDNKRVAGLVFDMDVNMMGEFMAAESYKAIEKVLDVKMDTMDMRVCEPMPPPPA